VEGVKSASDLTEITLVWKVNKFTSLYVRLQTQITSPPGTDTRELGPSNKEPWFPKSE
jgi:hypothetical protein